MVLDRARNQQLRLPEVIEAAQALTGDDGALLRVELYKNWIAFNCDQPLAHLAYFNYSVALREVGDLAACRT